MKRLSLLLLAFILISAINVLPAQNTISEAVDMIKAIKNSDPFVQDRKRAEKAFEIVRNRVEVLNDFSGTFLQTLPVDFWNYYSGEGNFKTRGQVLDVARAKGWSLAEVAWLIKGGQCDEHASLMQMLLKQAGVKNVKILRSNSPHAFPVVDLADDFDPDNPWTWGPHAFVPDTWGGAILEPVDTWFEQHNNPISIYFAKGKYYVNNGTDTNREKLKKMMDNGRAYLVSHCTVYHTLLQRFLRYPVDIRKTLSLQPPIDIECPESPKLVLLETSFETLNPETRVFEDGTSQKTPTSHWEIGNGFFEFESVKDGFHLEIYWDQLPTTMAAKDPVPFNVNLYTSGGPRKVEAAFYPVMDITGWQISQAKEEEPVQNLNVNVYKLVLTPDKESQNKVVKEGNMSLSVSAVGRDANVEDGKVAGGSGKFFRGKQPSEFDAYLLELNCNGLAKMQWSYVPEGSPHLKGKH